MEERGFFKIYVILDLNLTVKDEIGWSSHGDLGKSLILKRLEGDDQIVSAAYGDLDRRRSTGEEVVKEGTGGDSGSTGQGFTFNPALVSADGKVIWSQGLREVRVRSVGLEMIVVAEGCTVFDDVSLFYIIDKGDGVRNSGVEIVNGGAK